MKEFKKNKWFKFYGSEYLSDPKMLSLSPCERSCWLTLLCYACIANDNENDNGKVHYLDEQKLMIQANIDTNSEDWERTEGVLKKFEKLNMITLDNETIVITNWKKRQERALTGYERVKKHRKMKRLITNKITVCNEDDNCDDNSRLDKTRLDKIIIPPLPPKKGVMDGNDFDAFYKAYPRHESKAKAKEKFLKLHKELLPIILNAIQIQIGSEQWTKDNGKFIPHPSTWINNKRWEDEIPEKTKEQEARELVAYCEKEYGYEDGAEIAAGRFSKKYGKNADLEFAKIFKIWDF